MKLTQVGNLAIDISQIVAIAPSGWQNSIYIFTNTHKIEVGGINYNDAVKLINQTEA